jgi:hypothetical protein
MALMVRRVLFTLMSAVVLYSAGIGAGDGASSIVFFLNLSPLDFELPHGMVH